MFSRRQKNELFELINPTGLWQEDFSLIHNTELRITHIPSGFYIRLMPTTSLSTKGSTDIISILFTPDTTGILYRPNQEKQRGPYSSWKDTLNAYTSWLQLIKQETNTPDLWAEAAKTAQLFTGTTEAPDDKFTRTELAEVQGQLRQLQQSFEASTLPEAARQKLIELTQTAAVKAEGLTKKDWQNWIIGGFISSITSLALNPTQAQDVLKLVKAAFGGLFLH